MHATLGGLYNSLVHFLIDKNITVLRGHLWDKEKVAKRQVTY